LIPRSKDRTQYSHVRLSLFDWHDLDTAKFVGLAVGIAVIWRLIAWLAMSARVGGFS
jgi:hypothetical protein